MTTNPVQVNSDLEDLLPLEMVNGQRFVPLPSAVSSQQNLLEQSSIDLVVSYSKLRIFGSTQVYRFQMI